MERRSAVLDGPIVDRGAVRGSRLPLVLVTVVGLIVSGDMAAIGGGGRGVGREIAPPAADRSLSFEPNVGQAPAGVDFVARGDGYGVALTATRAVLALPGATARSELLGADEEARATPADRLPGRVNYLAGDPAKHRTDVPTYARVAYAGVYDGIDVVYYGIRSDLEYDFVVAPGADPSDIRIGLSGMDAVRLDGSGRLVMSTGRGELVQHAPVAYQEVGGVPRQVDARYVQLGAAEFGVRLGDYDRRKALVIDPVLAYSTYLGGSGAEIPGGIAVDAAGSAYVAATSNSFDYPTTPGALAPAHVGSGYNIVVTKLAPGGDALVYSTYVGEGQAEGIAVDPAGNAYVTGTTSSPGFPTVNAFQPAMARTTDAVVFKLNATGTALVYSSFLGGTDNDTGNDIAVDAAGSAYVTGRTHSADFPVVQPFQPFLRGPSDAYLTKVSSGSALLSSTFIGGSGDDAGFSVGVGTDGQPVVGGTTQSGDFPVTSDAVSSMLHGTQDGFIVRFDATGQNRIYSTYIGGSDIEIVSDLAVDAAGNAYATGITLSSDFPTIVPVQPAKGAAEDAFVVKLDRFGAPVYLTCLGGSGEDLGSGIGVDSSGRATVTGYTSSSSFPLVRPIQPSRRGLSDAFVTTLSVDGSSLLASTYLGGSSDDSGDTVAMDGSGSAYVLGSTGSTDFSTRNPFQAQPRGAGDLFVSETASDTPAVAGSAWYSSGATSQSGGVGTVVFAYATTAFRNIAYRLVLASGGGCSNVVAVLNPTTRFANASGFIPRTVGTIPSGTPAGTYQVCFQDVNGATATSGPSFTVQ